MSKIIGGEEYLNATEAIKRYGVSRQAFYDNIRPHLLPHRPGGRKTPLYRMPEIEAVMTGKPIRKGTIPITGMFSDWTEYARSLGYSHVQTENREVQVVNLPKDLGDTFHVATNQIFVKRGRMTFIDRVPVCSWDTYYPIEYVSDILPEIQQGTAKNIVGHIQEKGVTISKVKDRYSTRITTLDEMNLFQLLNDEPVLMLQRVSWTHDQQTVVLFSDMVLLGSWFVIEREEEMNAA